MISESTINKVRELSIEDVLEPYVRLSRKGSTLMGICPFHEERTGSFLSVRERTCSIVSAVTVAAMPSHSLWRKRTFLSWKPLGSWPDGIIFLLSM